MTDHERLKSVISSTGLSPRDRDKAITLAVMVLNITTDHIRANEADFDDPDGVFDATAQIFAEVNAMARKEPAHAP
jgi:hypothetical protein